MYDITLQENKHYNTVLLKTGKYSPPCYFRSFRSPCLRTIKTGRIELVQTISFKTQLSWQIQEGAKLFAREEGRK